MKNLKKLSGVKELTRSDQKSVNGGRIQCKANYDDNGGISYTCPLGQCCIGNACYSICPEHE